MAKKKRGPAPKYPGGQYTFRTFLGPIATRVKRLPWEERHCFLASLKPYLTDEDYSCLIAKLRERKLV